MVTELQPSSAMFTPESDDSGKLYYGLTLDTWFQAGTLGALFIAAYWVVLRWLWDKTNPVYGEANWGHGICIPIVGLYYLYINRDDLLKRKIRPTWMGLGIALVAMVIFAYGIWPGQNQFTQGCAMIMALFGVVLLLCGWDIMTIAWFPIVYLICGIPWPPLVYSWIASPLQTLAARVAVKTLQFTGVNAFRTGTKINMMDLNGTNHALNVAEACAGLRSLMTFITVGAAVAFLSARPLWQKIIITLSAIPIAIFCNVMRVAGQGLLDFYVSHQLSESFAHQFVGLIMLIPAFFLILLVGWILDHIFIEEAEVRTATARMAQRPTAGIGEVPRRNVPVTAPATKPAAAPVAPKTTSAPVAKAPAPPAKPAAAPAPAPAAKQPPPKSVAGPVPPAPAKPQQPQAAPTPPRPAGAPGPKPAVPPRPGITPPRPSGVVPPRPISRPPQQPPPTKPGPQDPEGT
jgi:exosortase